MTPEQYFDLKERVIEAGYEYDVTWAETVGECKNANDFACEYVYVVCNSGMKAQIARVIFDRVWKALNEGWSSSAVFGHKGKTKAIDWVFDNRDTLFAAYLAANDKLDFLRELPWIGDTTKYHLAKNFGVDCCKPDRHLVRIAKLSGETPAELCERLATETGNRIGVVDLVIWRAANLRFI